MNNPDPFLSLQKLSKVYASGRIHVTALSDVNLQVAAARFVAVTGASGSGKSTLLNLLGGLDTPTSGTIEVQGRRISDLDREELSLYRRSGVGMIFQSFNLIPSRTALENVELPLIFAGIVKRERRERAAGWLAEVGLAGRLDHRPSELSGGEQQRVAIARALVNNPQLILADEPTGNLDSRTGREIVELLAQLNRERGLTVMIVSHEVLLMRDFSHELIQLQDGRILDRERVQ
jgi:putative ABC transport system ATP-binding protein